MAVQLRGGQEGAGAAAVATEFLQTLQCVAFVIENCRTRESAVSPNLWANWQRVSQATPRHLPPPLQLPPTWTLPLNPCGLLHVATLAAASEAVAKLIK